jgi:hypothetical protein
MHGPPSSFEVVDGGKVQLIRSSRVGRSGPPLLQERNLAVDALSCHKRDDDSPEKELIATRCGPFCEGPGVKRVAFPEVGAQTQAAAAHGRPITSTRDVATPFVDELGTGCVHVGRVTAVAYIAMTHSSRHVSEFGAGISADLGRQRIVENQPPGESRLAVDVILGQPW